MERNTHQSEVTLCQLTISFVTVSESFRICSNLDCGCWACSVLFFALYCSRTWWHTMAAFHEPYFQCIRLLQGMMLPLQRFGAQLQSLRSPRKKSQCQCYIFNAIFTTTNVPVLSVEFWHVYSREPAGCVRPWLVEWIGMIWPVHWKPASHRSCPWPVRLRSTRGRRWWSRVQLWLSGVMMQSCTWLLKERVGLWCTNICRAFV